MKLVVHSWFCFPVFADSSRFEYWGGHNRPILQTLVAYQEDKGAVDPDTLQERYMDRLGSTTVLISSTYFGLSYGMFPRGGGYC